MSSINNKVTNAIFLISFTYQRHLYVICHCETKMFYIFLFFFKDVPEPTLTLSEYRADWIDVNEGDSVEMKCVVQANPRVHAIHWRKNVCN